jgi:hypothetical protein
MTPEEAGCPPLDTLARLTVLDPGDASVRRVRARCLAELAPSTRRGAAAAPRLEQAAALTAVGGFLAAIVTAALRLLAAR